MRAETDSFSCEMTEVEELSEESGKTSGSASIAGPAAAEPDLGSEQSVDEGDGGGQFLLALCPNATSTWETNNSRTSDSMSTGKEGPATSTRGSVLLRLHRDHTT